jgi:hypothetical protein
MSGQPNVVDSIHPLLEVNFGRRATVGINMIFADIATWKHSCLQHMQNTTQVAET